MDRKSGRKLKEYAKKACTSRFGVYRVPTGQADFDNFAISFGEKLRRDNRWVILADIIPWDEFEKRYASQFKSKTGNHALPVRVALGSLIVKEKMKLSDEDTVQSIQESHYLQYFIGYEVYKDEKPFDASLMLHFRKRLGAKILSEVNDLIIERTRATEAGSKPKDPPSGDAATENKGQLIVDATCAPQDVRFPNDVGILNEAREKTDQMIDTLVAASPEGTKRPRTYRKKARVKFLGFIRRRRNTEQAVRRALREQLQYVNRNLIYVKELVDSVGATKLSRKQYRDLLVISEVYRQQQEMYKTRNRSLSGRIVSISQPHVRAIARGKARAAFEFGAKVSLGVVNGFCRVDRLSWDPYNESTDLQSQIEDYRKRYGSYPESVHADKIYRTRDNLRYCKEHTIRITGPKLGRPYKETEENKKLLRELRKLERADEGIRSEVEGKFGVAKRRYSLGLIRAKLRATSETSIMLVFFMMNLERILREKLRLLFASIILMFQNCTESLQAMLHMCTAVA
jgi:hypothetical protein